MHARAIWAIARKDAVDLIQNKATLAGLLFPIVLSLLWLLISNVAGSPSTDILVYNPGHSAVEQVVVASFANPQVTEAGSAEEVAAAFGPSATGKSARYALGLIVPEGFDDSVRSGAHPQLQLYVDGGKVSVPTRALLQAAIANYGRTIASPQPPIDLSTTLINPPRTKGVVFELKTFYASLALLLSLAVGITFVPQLLIEEKEKKTLRMLMVTPASFEDVLVGKHLVVLVYQLLLSGVVVAILSGFTGQVALVVLYALLGACFSLSLGLLIGAVFNTVSAAAVEGLLLMIYVVGGIFVGPLGQLFGTNPAATIARLLPTYYIAEGAYNASQRLGTLGSNLLDVGVTVVSAVVLLAVSAWVLRRQAAVEAAF